MTYLSILPPGLIDLIGKCVYPVKVCANILIDGKTQNIVTCLNSVKSITDIIIIGNVESTSNIVDSCESCLTGTNIMFKIVHIKQDPISYARYRNIILSESRKLANELDPCNNYKWYILKIDPEHFCCLKDPILFRQELSIKYINYHAKMKYTKSKRLISAYWSFIYIMKGGQWFDNDWKWEGDRLEYPYFLNGQSYETIQSVHIETLRIEY
jgi:hypothetical protein